MTDTGQTEEMKFQYLLTRLNDDFSFRFKKSKIDGKHGFSVRDDILIVCASNRDNSR